MSSSAALKYIEIDYIPHKNHDGGIGPQEIFHASDADECVYGGAKGGGKSCALTMDAYRYASYCPRAKVYLFRRTYDELEANLVDELFKRVPARTKDNPAGLYSYDNQKHIARLPNGSRIFFRYIRNLQDAKKYNGREMDYCGVDELTQHEEEAINILRSCVRSPRGYPALFRATCNPGDIGHTHVKKRYIIPTFKGAKPYIDSVTGNKIQFVPAKVTDNPTIMENDPAYIRRLNGLPPTLRKAYLDGDWDIFEGQAFEEWNPSIHVCESFPIPEHWRKWRSNDPGYTDPFAWYWFAVDEDGRVHIYREYTRNYGDPKVVYTEQAQKVIELSTYKKIKDGQVFDWKDKYDFTIVGHDAFLAHAATKTIDRPQGKTIEDYYSEGGLVGLTRAVTDRKLRKTVWHEYLKPYYDENAKEWKSRVVIHDCCRMLIETLPQQLFDPTDPEKVKETDFDHWYDAAGYGLIAYHIDKSKPLKKEDSRVKKDKKRKTNAMNQKRVC